MNSHRRQKGSEGNSDCERLLSQLESGKYEIQPPRHPLRAINKTKDIAQDNGMKLRNLKTFIQNQSSVARSVPFAA